MVKHSNNVQWGGYGVDTTDYGTHVNTLESGYYATINMINYTSMVNYNYSIWNCINNIRGMKYNGCNDWFVGSTYLLEILRKSGKSGNLFTTGQGPWSSVENTTAFATYYSITQSVWYSNHSKSDAGMSVFGIRAF